MLFLLTLFSFCIIIIFALKLKKHGTALARLGSSGLLLISSLIFSLVIAESLCRYFEESAFIPKTKPAFFLDWGESSQHTMLKNSILYLAPSHYNYRTFGYPYRTNGLGFRERDFNFKKPKDIYRILVFGDSLTFGVGIDNDHRYTYLVEKLLNRDLKASKIPPTYSKIEVLNMGVAGYATDQEHDLIKSVLKFIECDLIIVGFYKNDLTFTTRSILRSTTSRNKKNETIFAKVPQFENPDRNWNTLPESIPDQYKQDFRWNQSSYLVRFLYERTNLFLGVTKPNPLLLDYVLNEFKGIREITRHYGIPEPIILLLHHGLIDPSKNNFRNPSGALAHSVLKTELVGKSLEKQGFSVIDTLPLFKEHSFMSMAVSEWENHPNYLGHYLYARSIYQWLV